MSNGRKTPGQRVIELEQRVAALEQHKIELERRVVRLEQEKKELRAAVNVAWSRIVNLVQVMQATIKVLERGQKELTATLNRLIGHYPQREPDTDFLIDQQMKRWQVRLVALMNEHFNEAELRNLCFNLHLDYEQLGSNGKRSKCRQIVQYFFRRNMLLELAEQLQQERPLVRWPLAPIDVDIDIDIDKEMRGMDADD